MASGATWALCVLQETKGAARHAEVPLHAHRCNLHVQTTPLSHLQRRTPKCALWFVRNQSKQVTDLTDKQLEASDGETFMSQTFKHLRYLPQPSTGIFLHVRKKN